VYLQEKGIKRELTVHDSLQQNGVSERLNHTIVELARAMLILKNVLKFLWGDIRKNGYCIYGYKYLIVIHNGPL
jgi:hypothetical protein